jgi:hypothetical protein
MDRFLVGSVANAAEKLVDLILALDEFNGIGMSAELAVGNQYMVYQHCPGARKEGFVAWLAL